MQLLWLSLENFRNYTTLELAFHPQVTRIVGDNAQGKTNLLEAVYFLGRGHSFRTSHRSDLICYECTAGIIRAQSTTKGLQDEWCVEITRERNRFLCNGKSMRSPDERWPYIILFAPEETMLFRGEPSGRREYLDALIAGLDTSYRTTLNNFRRVLQQRNRILHEAEGFSSAQVREQLAPWTEQLLEYGSKIIIARQRWIDTLNTVLQLQHAQFARRDGAIQLVYLPSVRDITEFRAALAARHDEELARRMTVVGPQRDDFAATLAGMDLKHYGSQGQHRSVVISLKLAEVRLVLERIGHAPILLLDDVASELDPSRIRDFLETIQAMECQIILSTVHLADQHARHQTRSATIVVQHGTILSSVPSAISL